MKAISVKFSPGKYPVGNPEQVGEVVFENGEKVKFVKYALACAIQACIDQFGGAEVETGKNPKGYTTVLSLVGGAPKGESTDTKIEKIIENKNDAIRHSSILRDASMFAVQNWRQYSGDTEADMLKNAHKYWQEYFDKEVY